MKKGSYLTHVNGGFVVIYFFSLFLDVIATAIWKIIFNLKFKVNRYLKWLFCLKKKINKISSCQSYMDGTMRNKFSTDVGIEIIPKLQHCFELLGNFKKKQMRKMVGVGMAIGIGPTPESVDLYPFLRVWVLTNWTRRIQWVCF